MLKRKDLLAILKKVEPAVDPKSQMEWVKCIYFTGKEAIAFDHKIGISVPCSLGIHGGLEGRVLIDWLAASNARDLKWEVEDGDVVLRAGRARHRIPIQPAEMFSFEMPDDPIGRIALSDQLVQLLSRVSTSMGTNEEHPWRMGITVRISAKRATFYSSDNFTASREPLPIRAKKGMSGTELIMSPDFVNLLLSSAKGERAGELLLGDGWVQCTFESGLRIYGLTIADVQVDTYEQLFDTLTNGLESEPVGIPKGMEGCLKRMSAVLSISDQKCATAKVRSGKLTLEADGSTHARDWLKLPEHGDVEIKFCPEYARRALPHCDRMLLSEECIYLAADGYEHVIAPGID